MRNPNAKDLTFIAWGDTHFGYETRFGEEDLRGRVVRQINSLEGWPLPSEFGGTVPTPQFVVLCGDAVDGQPQQAPRELDYYRYFTKPLKYPQYEVLGNHDTTTPFLDYFVGKYGGKSYSFDCREIHFISLNSVYDEKEQGWINPDDLAWLEEDLAQCGKESPVVLFVHTRLDSLKNPDEVLAVLAGRRIVLVLSAHKHKPDVFEWNGISCISIGHCRNHPIDPEIGRNFYVVLFRNGRLRALPWRWDLADWEQGRRWSDPSAVTRRLLLDKKL